MFNSFPLFSMFLVVPLPDHILLQLFWYQQSWFRTNASTLISSRNYKASLDFTFAWFRMIYIKPLLFCSCTICMSKWFVLISPPFSPPGSIVESTVPSCGLPLVILAANISPTREEWLILVLSRQPFNLPLGFSLVMFCWLLTLYRRTHPTRYLYISMQFPVSFRHGVVLIYLLVMMCLKRGCSTRTVFLM